MSRPQPIRVGPRYAVRRSTKAARRADRREARWDRNRHLYLAWMHSRSQHPPTKPSVAVPGRHPHRRRPR